MKNLNDMSKKELKEHIEKLQELGDNMASELTSVFENNDIFVYTQKHWELYNNDTHLKEATEYKEDLEEYLKVE